MIDARINEVLARLEASLEGQKADLVISDMAPNLSGVEMADAARMADLIELAHQQGTLETAEKETLLAILSLDEKTARDVMRPRPQLVMLPDTLAPEKMNEAARRSGHHRVPLYDETPDNVVGLLNSRTLLLNPGCDLFEAVEFPSFVPESINLLKLFGSLQRQHRGVAIVLDEFGSVSGLVTVRDILAFVVGEFRSARGTWRVADGQFGPVAQHLRKRLLDIQHGAAADPHGWVHRVV